MPDEAQVDVLMPVRNGGDLVQRAIESVLDQSLEAWRLHIWDNGSEDSTLDVIAQYVHDPRIVVHAEKGVTSALGNFRRALQAADAELACFLAHDDRWDRHFLEILTDRLRVSKHMSGFCPAVCLVAPDGTSRLVPFKLQRDAAGDQFLASNDVISHRSVQVNAWYGLYRTSFLIGVWRDVDPLVDDCNPASDRAYIAHALVKGRIGYEPRALYFKRTQRASRRLDGGLSDFQYRVANRQTLAAVLRAESARGRVHGVERLMILGRFGIESSLAVARSAARAISRHFCVRATRAGP